MTIKILSGVYNNFFEFAINVEDEFWRINKLAFYSLDYTKNPGETEFL